MRTVVSNNEVPKLWASQSQPEAFNQRRSLWFRGRRIYSYAACIGNLAIDKDGETVALISSNNWSVTSTRHVHRAWVAVYGKWPIFRVPSVEWPDREHDRNIDYLMSLAHGAADRAVSSRCDRWFLTERLTPQTTPIDRAEALFKRISFVTAHVTKAREYAAAFGQPLPEYDFEKLTSQVNAMFDRFLDPKAARRERAKASRARAKADRTKAEAERLAREYEAAKTRGWLTIP